MKLRQRLMGRPLLLGGMRTKLGRSPAAGMPQTSVQDVVTACLAKQVGIIRAVGIMFQGRFCPRMAEWETLVYNVSST